jgi:hypothetical protein
MMNLVMLRNQNPSWFFFYFPEMIPPQTQSQQRPADFKATQEKAEQAGTASYLHKFPPL